ncbi:glycoside hydrolase family 3 C-terminal domain-containing protein [Nocardia cyriacigeorgica]|uniref:glycoside hydrolase family 3 C-terminal domain-containing protein n=3 Tax=Nocardia cyriacigeorgica TaxID=135487 RepID=UPI000CEA45B1|nr:glycoside hydrolase family 3 C-terminal domain-containing protein [Nocardia cyriacigeorgica]MBF6323953.1 glycoside hydrolase family 3 C-terminal domain-containing protein [Nocardia cyriacigeorgica]MBF6496806.1 glycoside hydrolase family 3 C-terminal domain-containing protein [Nocardia cyriacigeorgica]PPJ15092.1 glycosyl hydrolase [Nocardia cyriacigeorgica]
MTAPTDISGLSLAEKAALGSGADFWTTKAVGPVPSILLTDGPHGVRRQAGATDHLGLAESRPATCFPPAVGLGQSWDADLVRRVGEALGREARDLEVDVLLGPGINIKRDPRCGRVFEYYSEDPLLTGVLGAAWVRGVQSTGVGASLKHFAVNNAEHDRMRSSSDVDARPLREIYLRAFAHIVRTARPWTVMCSYNRINGVYAAHNRWLLTDVLRGHWAFDGLVVSDWGAVSDRVASVAAGLDLQMPGGSGDPDAQVVAAVESGALDIGAVDRAAQKVAELAAKVLAGRAAAPAAPDPDAHHRLAREVAARCVVLLRNDGQLLPLRAGQSLAVIGEFAQTPRYQGGGSSHVNPTRLDVPVDEIRAAAEPGQVRYARGFRTDSTGPDPVLVAEAVAAAREAEVAVVFLGLGAGQESEGFDRDDIELPADQLALLAEVVAVQPKTVVVLSHGGVLRLAPVTDLVPAIVDGALLGQAGGGALADVLFGRVNPSGRLTETVPLRLQDVPAYLNFPGENSHIRYGEGIFVGYRWYDAREMAVSFPFGHGLSYTDFAYSDLSVQASADGLTVQVTVTNTGDRRGREVVQIYTALPDSAITRPPRELKGHALTDELEPGASQRVSIPIERDWLAYWETRAEAWVVEGGTYRVMAGASSRDIRAMVEVEVPGDELRLPITRQSTLGEVLADPAAAAMLSQMFAAMTGGGDGDGQALGVDMMRMLASIPLDRLTGFGMPAADLDALLSATDDRR